LAACVPRKKYKFEFIQIYTSRSIRCLFRSSSGAGGIGLEPNHSLLPLDEDFLLLTKGLLDAVEAMEKFANESRR
jgi:hypothetical protein